jgi:ElaB/YqjD/DUF883 family membrane-anchored ribosome-binding protein
MTPSSTAAVGTAHSPTDELKALIREAQEALSDANEGKNHNLEDIRSRLRAVVDEGKTLVANLGDSVKRQAGRADDTIRAHPYQSIGIAAGVGVLVGLLVSRRCGSSGS